MMPDLIENLASVRRRGFRGRLLVAWLACAKAEDDAASAALVHGRKKTPPQSAQLVVARLSRLRQRRRLVGPHLLVPRSVQDEGRCRDARRLDGRRGDLRRHRDSREVDRQSRAGRDRRHRARGGGAPDAQLDRVRHRGQGQGGAPRRPSTSSCSTRASCGCAAAPRSSRRTAQSIPRADLAAAVLDDEVKGRSPTPRK